MKSKAAMVKFGTDTNRSTFMTILPVPGPGTYDQHIPRSQKMAPTVTFGQTDRAKNPKARFSTRLYISALHTAEQLAAETPGPGAYAIHTGKGVARSIGDGASCKMGTGKRDNKKMFISRAHATVDGVDAADVPGPGQYKPNEEITSKFRSPGGRAPVGPTCPPGQRSTCPPLFSSQHEMFVFVTVLSLKPHPHLIQQNVLRLSSEKWTCVRPCPEVAALGRASGPGWPLSSFDF